MALRRLFSGWLIAMAALARSVAQVLERASDDRSAPPPDPIMAALAERYPGAPAHWLAHLAERTSQLAEVGAAPWSLDSEPTAASPKPEFAPSGPEGREPVSRDLEGSVRSRRDADVPTLAALRERSSEVWRRSEPERPRRPRPVFAPPPEAAPSSERAVRPAPESGRRPRSPLSLVRDGLPLVEGSSEPSVPTSEALASRAPAREAVWSAAESRLARPEPTTVRPEAQRPTERSPTAYVAARTRPDDASQTRPETLADSVVAAPAHRRRPWFFARSASARHEHALNLSPPRERAERSPLAIGSEADDPGRANEAFSYPTADRPAVAPRRSWPGRTTPASRRSIFQALAALRSKPRSRADWIQTSGSSAVRTAARADRPSLEPKPKPSTHALTPFPPDRPGRAAVAFPAVEPDGAPIQVEGRKLRPIVDQGGVSASARPAPKTETLPQVRRTIFAPARPSSSRPAASRFADAPPTDRWPALPPTILTPPAGVEAAPPRWDVLAREQEEGRWSV